MICKSHAYFQQTATIELEELIGGICRRLSLTRSGFEHRSLMSTFYIVVVSLVRIYTMGWWSLWKNPDPCRWDTEARPHSSNRGCVGLMDVHSAATVSNRIKQTRKFCSRFFWAVTQYVNYNGSHLFNPTKDLYKRVQVKGTSLLNVHVYGRKLRVLT